jgi:hypothetical protein
MEKMQKNEDKSTVLRPAIYGATNTRSNKTKWPKDKPLTNPGDTKWPNDKSQTRPGPINMPVKKISTLQDLANSKKLEQLDTSLEPRGLTSTTDSNGNVNGIKISTDFMQKTLNSHNVRLKAPS